MNARELFLFDLNGFLVVRGVLSADEVAAMNIAVDAHLPDMQPRAEALKNAKAGTAMSAEGPRIDLGGVLAWESDVPTIAF